MFNPYYWFTKYVFFSSMFPLFHLYMSVCLNMLKFKSFDIFARYCTSVH
jgi:hypothetical protein